VACDDECQCDCQATHDVSHAILGWSGDLGYLVRVHGQEFNSFRRSTRSKALRHFQLHRQEKFLYVCDVMDLWEWDVQASERTPSFPANISRLSQLSASRLNAPTLFIPALGRIVFP
jgi:hypothetical protein